MIEVNTRSSGLTFPLPFQFTMSIYPALEFSLSKIEPVHVRKKLLFASNECVWSGMVGSQERDVRQENESSAIPVPDRKTNQKPSFKSKE